MNTEIVPSSPLSTPNLPAMRSYMPDMGGVSREDLQIPTLSLIQKMSKLVDEGKAKAGDIFDSMEDKVVTSEGGKPLEFIPLFASKSWQEFRVLAGNKKEYIRTVSYGPDNADWRYEATGEDGLPIQRKIVMTYNLILADQITGGEAMPYRISFKGKSFQTGKKLATLIAKGAFLKLPIYGKTYFLSTDKETNEHGTYNVFVVKPGRVTTPDELAVCEQWAPMFAPGSQVKVVEDDSFEIAEHG